MTKIITLMLVLLINVTSAASAAEQVFFYHTDPVGTPLAMTNASGVVTWKADYKPFGEENSISGSAVNNKQFVGKEKDSETGLSYFGARYEDAKIGRFTAVDPVRAVDPGSNSTNEKMLLDPQKLNSYAYSLNNPYRYLDPDGRETFLVNRAFGSKSVKGRAWWNGWSHTYVAVTNNKGVVVDTFSWGNEYASGKVLKTGWSEPGQKNDKIAAQDAINRGLAISFGDLDNFIAPAYNKLKKSGLETWLPGDNCKHKTNNLLDAATMLKTIEIVKNNNKKP